MNELNFPAFRIHQDQGRIAARLETLSLSDLGPGDVVVRVHYSTINYKDALAATGKGKILRKYPLVGGIDLAGEVVRSSHPDFAPGDAVLVNGCGLSETHDGGYAEYARVSAEWLVPIPAGLDARSCMAIGTAGFTAALAIHRMEENGVRPEGGEIAVTGATGGVGSLAIDMLTARGYRVAAITGKRDQESFLRALGAQDVLIRDEIELGSRPLEAARWGGAIDSIGGEVLDWLIRTADFHASIASIGMAASTQLNTTVLPFILRGVNLLGINSVYVPRPVRLRVWDRIATDLRPRHLDEIVTQTIDLADLPAAFQQYLDARVTGRIVVRIP